MSGDITQNRTDAQLEQPDDHADASATEIDPQRFDYASDEQTNEIDDDLEDGLVAIDELGADDFLQDEFDTDRQDDQAELDDRLDEDLDAQLDAEPDDSDLAGGLDSDLEVDALADLLEDAGDDDGLDSIVNDAKLSSSKKRGLSVEARRAIEERAEMRRMERDLNYLDFDLED